MFFLFLDILADLRLVKPNRTDTVASRPETSPEQGPGNTLNLTIDPNSTFTLEVTNRHRNTKLWRHTQQEMDMIDSRVALDNPDAFLTT